MKTWNQRQYQIQLASVFNLCWFYFILTDRNRQIIHSAVTLFEAHSMFFTCKLHLNGSYKLTLAPVPHRLHIARRSLRAISQNVS